MPRRSPMQDRAYRHNSYKGGIAMANQAALAVYYSNTTTKLAKGLALQVHILCGQIQEELKTRVDNPEDILP